MHRVIILVYHFPGIDIIEDTMSKKVAIYIRVSTEKQAEKASPEAQENDCRKYCADHDYEVVAVYKDIERYRLGRKMVEPSGSRADRPGLKAILEGARAGQFDVIVAWREDRLYRSYRPMVDVLDCLENSSVEIELVKEYFDRTMVPVKMWAAKMELDAKHDRFLMGVTGRLEKGKTWSPTPPYGYIYDEDTRQLLVYEPEAEWVRKIFEWRSQGTPIGEIRQRLVSGGALMRKKNKHLWALTEIRKRLLYAPYWTGLMKVKWDAETYEIPIPAIVETETAAIVLEIASRYKAYPAGNLRALALVPGRVVCHNCGDVMQVVSNKQNSHEYYYYACMARSHIGFVPKECARFVKMARIDDEVWDRVWRAISEPGEFEQALQARITEIQEKEVDAESSIDRLSKSIDDLTMERQRVITWARRKAITEEDMEMQLLALTFQERELQKELNTARLLTGHQAERLLEFAGDYRKKVMIGAEALNNTPITPDQACQLFEFRRKIVNEIVSHVEVMPDKSIKVYSVWSFEGLLVEDPSS